MPDFDLGTGKRLAGYSLVLGIVYLVFGLIEVFGSTGETIPGGHRFDVSEWCGRTI